MTAARKSRASGNWLGVYGGPLVIGMLSLAGMLVALLFDGGAGRYFSWIALGTPIAVTTRFLIRRKNPK
jgi:O-antigen/teichoic acid export membrane protein